VPERVREQVQQHALDLRGRAHGPRVLEPALDPDVAGAGLGLEAADARLDERADGDLLQLVLDRARVDARELEEVVDEQREPARLLVQRRKVLGRLRQPVLDRLEHGRHRGDRRAQVVARGRDELAARVEQALEALGHRVERAAQLCELARAALGGPNREVAARERGGRAAEPVDPVHDRAGDGERRDDGRCCGGRGHGEDLHVVAHVEHDPAGQEHGEERQHDREQREAGDLEPHGGQAAQRQGGDEPSRERRRGDRERQPDHGTNR
jgi:hypothetical protein